MKLDTEKTPVHKTVSMNYILNARRTFYKTFTILSALSSHELSIRYAQSMVSGKTIQADFTVYSSDLCQLAVIIESISLKAANKSFIKN